MTTYKQEFGAHIRSLRKARGLTQGELSRRSDLGVDTIRRIEGGRFSCSIDTLRKVAFGLNLSVTTMFESFELGGSDTRRELVDLVAGRDDRELQLVLRVVRLLLNEIQSLHG